MRAFVYAFLPACLALLVLRGVALEPASDLQATTRHKVVAADTLFGISRRYYGNPWQWKRIYEANKDRIPTPDAIELGVVLVIPGRSGGARHTIAAGDTLFALSRRYYGNAWYWRRILDANMDRIDDPAAIPVGTVLRIPGAGSTSPPAPVPPPAPEQVSPAGVEHVVVPGDTLYGLARRYYGSPWYWKRIYRANRERLPDSDSLEEGQVLFIPEGRRAAQAPGKPSPPERRPAEKKAAPAALEPEDDAPKLAGMKRKVPIKEPEPPDEEPVVPESKPERVQSASVGPDGGRTIRQVVRIKKDHEVVVANTLWDLAARYYNDPWQWPRIYSANLDRIANPNLIYPGQVLIIPGLGKTVTVVRKLPPAPAPKPEPVEEEPPPLPDYRPDEGGAVLPDSLSVRLPEGLAGQAPSMYRMLKPAAWKPDGLVVEYQGRVHMAAIGDMVRIRISAPGKVRKYQRYTIYRRTAPGEDDVDQSKDANYVQKVGIVEVNRKLSENTYRAEILVSGGSVQLGDILKRED